MEGSAFRVFHLDTARGPRFCVHHPAAAGRPRRGACLYVHAFAEEMNKSRRMAAASARAFAARGFEVLQIDLHGCGDSPGDFVDATWAGWLDDVRDASRWLAARTGAPPWWWGLRAGCLIAQEAARAEVASGGSPPAGFLFWQPPASGKLVAQQFLRLRIAADALRVASSSKSKPQEETRTKAATAAATDPPAGKPAAPAAAGEIEVAGYRLAPALLSGLQQAQMDPPAWPAHSAWLEVTSRQPAELLPGTQRHVAEWSAAGQQVLALALEGPGFWQTQEVLVVPSLLQASLDWLEKVAANPPAPADVR